MDYGEFGIRVNSISPGWCKTRENLKAAHGDFSKWEPIWGKYSMLRRMAEPVEIAPPTLFLLSDEASYITATELMVDGGYCSLGPEGLGENSNFDQPELK